MRSHPQRLPIFDVVGVQIAVRFLHGDDFIDGLLGHSPHVREISRLQGKSHSFRPLIDVGVGEDGATLGRITLTGEAPEIIHAPVSLQQIVHGGNAFRDVDLAPLSPKTSLDRDRVHGNLP